MGIHENVCMYTCMYMGTVRGSRHNLRDLPLEVQRELNLQGRSWAYFIWGVSQCFHTSNTETLHLQSRDNFAVVFDITHANRINMNLNLNYTRYRLLLNCYQQWSWQYYVSVLELDVCEPDTEILLRCLRISSLRWSLML